MKLGDYARMYDKALHSSWGDDAFEVFDVGPTLSNLHKAEESGNLDSAMLKKIKDAFLFKWDSIEVNIDD